MKIKKIIISVACLLLATALAIAGSFGYVTVKANNDAKMQEQYNAGYNASVDGQAAELELLGIKIADLQNQLANVGDPAIAALVENVGAAVESGDDDAVDGLMAGYLEQGGSQTVVELLQTLIGFASEYAALQAELDEMTKLNEEMLANSIAETIKFNNQIKELNATIAELQAQIEELQNSGGSTGGTLTPSATPTQVVFTDAGIMCPENFDGDRVWYDHNGDMYLEFKYRYNKTNKTFEEITINYPSDFDNYLSWTRQSFWHDSEHTYFVCGISTNAKVYIFNVDELTFERAENIAMPSSFMQNQMISFMGETLFFDQTNNWDIWAWDEESQSWVETGSKTHVSGVPGWIKITEIYVTNNGIYGRYFPQDETLPKSEFYKYDFKTNNWIKLDDSFVNVETGDSYYIGANRPRHMVKIGNHVISFNAGSTLTETLDDASTLSAVSVNFADSTYKQLEIKFVDCVACNFLNKNAGGYVCGGFWTDPDGQLYYSTKISGTPVAYAVTVG